MRCEERKLYIKKLYQAFEIQETKFSKSKDFIKKIKSL